VLPRALQAGIRTIAPRGSIVVEDLWKICCRRE
jgi:hypothetical protein